MAPLWTTAWCLLAAICGIACVQGVIVMAFVRLLRRARPGVAGGSAHLPPAAVVLALRGAEPRLHDVIERLLDQDYPRYQVHVVVDHIDDPAWDVVSGIASTAPADRLRIDVLRTPSSSCSLKCSALAQAVEDLHEDTEIVAFIDADATPYRSWLRDLAAPLADPATGVTTGNRWYVPRTSGHGGLLRHFWNAGAVVQVWLNGIPWAGSMAMRKATLVDTGVIRSWRRSLSVDGAVGRRMRACRRRVRFVPEAMMANHEDVSRRDFASWLVRQLVAARSSGAGGVLIPAHATLMLFCLVAPAIIVAAAAMQRNGPAAAVAAAAGATYWAAGLWCAAAIDRAVRSVLERQGNADAAPQPVAPGIRILALIDAHLVHVIALCRAFCCRSVRWRGIEYAVGGPETVRMTAYLPYRKHPIESGMSIT